MTLNGDISILGAAAAGVVSFLSPCVLPLVPAYLSFLAGTSLSELQTGRAGQRGRLLLTALAFVLGFSAVFILLGATATVLGRWVAGYFRWLERLAGALIVVLGLHVTGLLRLPFLMVERRLHPAPQAVGLVQAFGVGAAFAFGWTPCVGPILAGILALAGTQETVSQGMVLLSAYAAGLGAPFLLAALAVNGFLAWMQRFKRYLRWVEIVSGALLIAIGLAIAFGGIARISAWFGALGSLAL
jgi:cytochrome c-type biogenesis protein